MQYRFLGNIYQKNLKYDIILCKKFNGGQLMANKWVYLFEEGDAGMRNTLGGKGANLAEMTRLGLPVPQGFTITTQACTQYQ